MIFSRTKSALHVLSTDEIFHFYLGDPVTMLNLFEDGRSSVITLGQDILKGHHVQYKVPAKNLARFHVGAGRQLCVDGDYYDAWFCFSDFKTANKDVLITQYPDRREMIERLTDS